MTGSLDSTLRVSGDLSIIDFYPRLCVNDRVSPFDISTALEPEQRGEHDVTGRSLCEGHYRSPGARQGRQLLRYE